MLAETLNAAWFIASGAGFLVVFFLLKKRAFPSSDNEPALQERDLAIRQAGDALTRLCDIPTQGAYIHAAVWVDEDTTERLHQMRLLARLEPVLSAWGLRGSWRVRFRFPWGTALVGLAPNGDVVALELTGDVPDGQEISLLPSDEDLMARLRNGVTGTIWARGEEAGAGHVQNAKGEIERTKHLRAESATGLRFVMSVRTAGRRIRHVQVLPEITATPAGQIKHAELFESLAGTGSMVGALVAFITATSILALTDGVGDVGYALALAVGVLVAVLVTLPDDLRYTTVNAFDAQISWSTFRVINATTLLIQGLVMAGVAAVAAVAGGYVAERIGLALFDNPGQQIWWGLWGGAAWLGISAALYAGLRAVGKLEISPNLSSSLLRLSGHGWRQVGSISLQSSIGEEAVFRLLAIPVLLWFTGSPWIAVLISSVFWAFLHVGSAYRPRWFRVLELTACGIVLGVVMLEVGFIAALVAHAAYNAMTLAVPLLSSDRSGARSPRTVESAS